MNKDLTETIKNIPLCVDPCKMCKRNKNRKKRDFMPDYDLEICKECCWFYDSKFEV